MNGRTAKAIRKKIYGNNSKRNEYKYTMRVDKDPFGNLIQCMMCAGLRADYLKAKREFKNGSRRVS